MAGKIRHLLCRNGRYSARVAVPQALRQIIGKRELLEALGADRTIALRKLPSVVARMQTQLDRARVQVADNGAAIKPARNGKPLSLNELALSHYRDQLKFDEDIRATDSRYAERLFDAGDVADLKRAASGAATDQELASGRVGWVVHWYQRNGNITAKFGTPEWRKAAMAVAVAELESEKRAAERNEGEFSGKPDHPLLTEPPKIEIPKDALMARAIGPDSAKPLQELLPDYLKERGASAHSDFDSHTTVRMLDEFLDEARPVYRLTRADINGFKRALAETPSSYVKRFPNLKLPEAIKANKARKEPYPVLHHRTINDKYLSKLHSLLNWCVRNEIIPDNPATGIKVASLKGSTERPRVDFSPDDLTRLFGPKHFDRTKPLDEFQWAMLIALFSGTRASELAQIKLNSVQHHRGVLALAIEEQTKNLGSQRLIPVHSTLINMGLEQRVAQLRKQGETHLFPKWYRDGVAAKERATSRNSMANNQYFVRFIPKRFNNSYLPKVGIHDPRKTWHSFRHSFKSGLARAGVPRDMSDALTGHADHSAGGGYVHGASVEAMKEAIEKLRIDGFDLATP